MVETNNRRLPVGIQSFEEIRKEGYLYVDKTDIIWQLANEGKSIIRAKQYIEPFKADKRKVIALAIELDEKGKGLVDWKEV